MKIHMVGPWRYIMKDEGRNKIKIDMWGISGHPGSRKLQFLTKEKNLFLGPKRSQNGAISEPSIRFLGAIS